MQIWVDADACPRVIKDILYRAADRVKIITTLVANQPLLTPRSPYIKSLIVGSGFDVADNEIVDRLEKEDLVITADIPLASAAIDKEAYALNPRGQFYTRENIKQRLGMRNFMEELRGAGVQTGGPPTLNHRDRMQFANELDRFLTRHQQQSQQ